jgi:hypothetical protein
MSASSSAPWLLAGCASNKPPADQVFLMPAPAVYSEGRTDPLGSSASPADQPPPCILYATDRAPTTETERFAHYSDERANVLRLGEACIEPAGDQPLTWAELRRISLLKDRSDRYPLRVGSVDEYGILERSVPPFAAGVERSPLPGERFAAALDARLAAAGSKDVTIYVHGYKVDYENPVLVAGELWNFLGNDGAFIAYSWPSTRKTLAYWSDLDDALNSARGLRMLITFLSEHTDAENIHVIGYSAGTRLVARMLADLGMYSAFAGEDEIRRRLRLGHVITGRQRHRPRHPRRLCARRGVARAQVADALPVLRGFRPEPVQAGVPPPARRRVADRRDGNGAVESFPEQPPEASRHRRQQRRRRAQRQRPRLPARKPLGQQ